ncbi:hypothetical protein BGY98DRAFT_916382 [Russula aff. rugulosa BPL654]|nr:hypothetical protein BGY98DRAFT_916382 [Russula aff. rugulosa BPL654]
MKSFAVLSLVATLAVAQQSPSNPLVPSDISQSCQDFYSILNADPSLPQCLQPIISATAPLESSNTTPSPSDVITALNSICSSSTTCDPSHIGSLLGQFYQACQNEITGDNQNVILTYDSLYLIGPLASAVCQKDTSNNYCVASYSSSNTTKRASLDRRDDSQEVFMPNAELFSTKNVAFLGIQPSLSATQLCVPCTREVMNIYIAQLGRIPYAPSISKSVLFPSEPELYTAINQKCGASFLGGAVQAAGGLATGAAPRSVDGGFALVSSAIAAAAAGAVALL